MALSRRTGARFQASIWPGFVDAMTGLLLVLMFVLTIFMVVQFVLTERISGQESELDALSTEMAALAQALGLQERTNSDLEARLGALQISLSDAEDQAAAQSALIASLRADRAAQDAALTEADAALAAADAALTQAETRITSFEARVAALIAERDGALGQVSDLEAREQQLLSEQDALNAALAARRDEIDAQTEAARLAAARREALEALVADLRARNTDAADRIEAPETDVAATRDELCAQEAARLADAAAAEALRARLQNADTELTAMTLSLEAQRARAEETLTLLAAARAAEEELNTRLAAALVDAEGLERQLSAAEVDAQTELDQLRAALTASQAEVATLQARLSEDQSTAEAELAGVRDRLAAALAAKLAAEGRVEDTRSEADRRAALLEQAKADLAREEETSAAAQRQTELLNQQVAALRSQLSNLQGLLDVAVAEDAAREVELQTLGTQLNTALARVAAEQRRRAELEAAERARLEAEKKNLEQYRSEFFGQLRGLLGNQEGVRIEGDRFVFSSEVLFAPGQASLSPSGQGEIAKVANILRAVAADIPENIDWIIRVDGHTDDTPLSGFGQFADNWELSQARALSVVKFMSGDLGLPPDRLSANGFGQYQPVDPRDTDAARARNRRIELKLTEK